MAGRRGFRHVTVAPLDDRQKLYEVGSKEIWQLPLKSRDGVFSGVVVRQVIEPLMYTVRYLVIYSPDEDRRFVLPANTIADITSDGVTCSLTREELERLPAFEQSLNQEEEEAVYDLLQRTPYWVEEREAMQQNSEQQDP